MSCQLSAASYQLSARSYKLVAVMVSFTSDDHGRVAAGEITVTWRLWKYPHVKAGKAYATGFGGAIAVEDVRAVRAADITDDDALAVGFADASSLIEYARSHTGRAVTLDTLLYRVQFHYETQEPPKPVFSLEEIRERLQRLDSASESGVWTLTALRLIEENPGVVARKLALEAGLPRDDFKANVRKLKRLGLTLSLPVGYELTELGQTYLDGQEAS